MSDNCIIKAHFWDSDIPSHVYHYRASNAGLTRVLLKAIFGTNSPYFGTYHGNMTVLYERTEENDLKLLIDKLRAKGNKELNTNHKLEFKTLARLIRALKDQSSSDLCALEITLFVSPETNHN